MPSPTTLPIPAPRGVPAASRALLSLAVGALAGLSLTGCSLLSDLDAALAPSSSAPPGKTAPATVTPPASSTAPAASPTAAPTGRTASAVVVRVVDGDTVVLKSSRGHFTVRLLNVDTPETKKPNVPVQCLGPEATAFTKTLLPPETRVTLTYDKQRTDRYGRDLAKVSTPTVPNVSAAIAEAGMGTALYIAPNKAFLPEVQAAQARAEANRRGLFSTTLTCTPGAAAS